MFAKISITDLMPDLLKSNMEKPGLKCIEDADLMPTDYVLFGKKILAKRGNTRKEVDERVMSNYSLKEDCLAD